MENQLSAVSRQPSVQNSGRRRNGDTKKTVEVQGLFLTADG
jgi:hypothetical protein